MTDEDSRIALPVLQKHRSSEPVIVIVQFAAYENTFKKHEYKNKWMCCGRKDSEPYFKKITSWKKLLSGYKLLRAILKELGATASLRVSVDAMLRAVNISNNAQTTQGFPT